MTDIQKARDEMWAAYERAKAAALDGTATYHLVEDSNLITYLKLDLYGYVAQERAGVRTPMNLGVELPPEVLSAAWASA